MARLATSFGPVDKAGKILWRSSEPRVRQNCVVLTVVATVKPFAEVRASPTGRTCIVNSRGDGGQRELGSGESAA
jgi:hypothetical protein